MKSFEGRASTRKKVDLRGRSRVEESREQVRHISALFFAAYRDCLRTPLLRLMHSKCFHQWARIRDEEALVHRPWSRTGGLCPSMTYETLCMCASRYCKGHERRENNDGGRSKRKIVSES